MKTLHTDSKCCLYRCRGFIIRLQLNDGRNPQFRWAILLISSTDVVVCILLSWLGQFVKLHLLLAKSLYAPLYHFGDCSHHPAGFVIFTHLAQLYLFIILIFPILSIVGTWKITQKASHRNHNVLKSHSGLLVHHSCDFSILLSFLRSLNLCLCVFISLSCSSGFSLNIILN